MTIGEAVRRIRKRLGMNQMQFSEMVGCQLNTISRYELGKFPPGPITLMRILQIAKSAGLSMKEERDVIMRELKVQYDRGLVGGGQTVEETIALMGPLLEEIQKADRILHAVPERKRQDYGFRQFIPAVAHTIEVCETVDQSVTDVLQLWAAHSQNEAAVQYFRDAVGFLRAQLWKKESPANTRQDTGAVKPRG